MGSRRPDSEHDRAGPRPYAPRLPPEDRREQLLDAALDVGIRQGFTEITMGTVAKACGVTRPVVYSQFRNRHDLVGAMFDREVAGALDDLADALPTTDEDLDTRAAYIRGVRAFLTAVLDHPFRWQIALAQPHGVPVEIRSLVQQHRRRVVESIEQFVRVHSPTPVAEPELLSLVIVGMLERLATSMLLDPERLGIDRVMDFAESLFDPIWGAVPEPTGG